MVPERRQSARAARTAARCIHAPSGEESVTKEAYIYLPGVAGGEEIAARLGVDYFAVKVVLGRDGAARALDIGTLSEDEEKLLEVALKDLKVNIQSGRDFMEA